MKNYHQTSEMLLRNLLRDPPVRERDKISKDIQDQIIKDAKIKRDRRRKIHMNTNH